MMKPHHNYFQPHCPPTQPSSHPCLSVSETDRNLAMDICAQALLCPFDECANSVSSIISSIQYSCGTIQQYFILFKVFYLIFILLPHFNLRERRKANWKKEKVQKEWKYYSIGFIKIYTQNVYSQNDEKFQLGQQMSS